MIRPATGADVEAVRTLFREYADGLGIDLSFQDFDAELADPLGLYACSSRPAGASHSGASTSGRAR